jgi:bacterioferritin-associated ferredoxin
LRRILTAVEETEHAFLAAGRSVPTHLTEIRRALGAPGVGDGCATCVDAADRAATASDLVDAKLADAWKESRS